MCILFIFDFSLNLSIIVKYIPKYALLSDFIAGFIYIIFICIIYYTDCAISFYIYFYFSLFGSEYIASLNLSSFGNILAAIS